MKGRGVLFGTTILLAALLSWQVVERGAGQAGSLSGEQPVTVSSFLPLGLEEVTEIGGSIELRCRVAFVFDPGCERCTSLARDLSSEEAQPENAVLWIGAGPSPRLAAFAEETGARNVVRFSTPEAISAASVLRYLDIRSVPTRLIFDRQGRVADIRLDNTVPDPGDELLCTL